MKNSLIFISLIVTLIFSVNGFSQVVQRKNSNAKPVTSPPKNNAQNNAPPKNNSQNTNRRETSISKPVREKRSYVGSNGGFQEGDKLLNVGVGLSSYYYGTPIGLSFESGVSKDISVGLQLDYNSGDYDDYDYYGYNYRYYSYGYSAYYVGARGSYHLGDALKIRSDKVDLYVGAGLGY